MNISESFGFNVAPELLFNSVTDPVAAERLLTAADDVETPRRVYAFLDWLVRGLESVLLRAAPAVQVAETG